MCELEKISDNIYYIWDSWENERVGKVEIIGKRADVQIYEKGNFEIFNTGMIRCISYRYSYKPIGDCAAVETEITTTYIYENLEVYHDSPSELDDIYDEIMGLID